MASADATEERHTLTAFEQAGRLRITVVQWTPEIIKIFRQGRHETTCVCLGDGTSSAMMDGSIMRRFKSNSRKWVREFNAANPKFYALPYKAQMDVLYNLAPEVHGHETLNIHNESLLHDAMRRYGEDERDATAKAEEKAEGALLMATTQREKDEAMQRVRDVQDTQDPFVENPKFFDIDTHIAEARSRPRKLPVRQRRKLVVHDDDGETATEAATTEKVKKDDHSVTGRRLGYLVALMAGFAIGRVLT